MTGYRIQHIDLTQPLTESLIQINLSAESIYSIFWWHDIPLGTVVISAAELPLTPTALATLAAQTVTPTVQTYLAEQNLAEQTDQSLQTPLDLSAQMAAIAPLKFESGDADTSVSIVVCTRDRPQQLADCLQSLQALNPPASEIIVVDNAPTTTATQDIVQKFPRTRYVVESQPGLSRARNTGIRQSKGDLIVFTDDDVQVHPHWLEPIHAAFLDPQTMAVTGLVIPTELRTETQALFELSLKCLNNGCQPKTYDLNFFKQHQKKGVPVWDIGAGANMAFRREIFEKVGEFDPRLGAGAAGCSEDSELWYRILAAGWRCQYQPAAVVYHTHREDIAALRQQMHSYMRGHVVSLLIQFSHFQHWGNLRRLVFELPRFYWQLLNPAIRHRFRGRYRTYWSELGGYLSGPAAYFQLKWR